SEEMASTSEELSSQAEQLQATISFFKTGDDTSALIQRKPLHLQKTKVAHAAKQTPERYEPHSRPKELQADKKRSGVSLGIKNGEGSDDGKEFERY
ncbi:MAG: hypothetical protein HQL03_16195, partial [Nitrospirae bacterium]|nr:hypothetical protein [Nitrospirota bacterium]